MRSPNARRILAGCLIGVLAGCSTGHPVTASDTDRDLLTREAFQGSHHLNAYHLIQQMRPHWLETRSPRTGGSQRIKQVYLDELHLGGLEQLRQIPTSSIEEVRHFDGPAATQKWGTGHAAGAIQVRTRLGSQLSDATSEQE